jgi:hypothetical protein
VIAALLPVLCGQQPPKFRDPIVDGKPGGPWARAVADPNGDGRPNLILTGGNPARPISNEGK